MTLFRYQRSYQVVHNTLWVSLATEFKLVVVVEREMESGTIIADFGLF
jgi:hypothetical protein